MKKRYYYQPNKRNYRRPNRRINRRNNFGNKINKSNIVKLVLAITGIIALVLCGTLIIKSLVIAIQIATVYIGAIIAPLIITLAVLAILAAIIYVARFFKRR